MWRGRHDGKVEKKNRGKNKGWNIKVTQQSIFCDLKFHMMNPGHSSCYCHQELMMEVTRSQETQHFIICINIIGRQEATVKGGDGCCGPTSPAWSVTPSPWQHDGADRSLKPCVLLINVKSNSCPEPTETASCSPQDKSKNDWMPAF